MVTFRYVNRNYFQVMCEDKKFLDQLHAYFAVHVENYKFMPKYRAGLWNGKIKYFDKMRQTLPVGLVQEASRYIQKFHRDKRIVMDIKLKKLLFNKKYPKIEPEDFTLDRKPWEHQIKSIEKGIYHRRAVIKAPTGGGKSYIISCIINFLLEKEECEYILLCVPTIQLVEQFKGDMIEYGILQEKIGIIHGETDKIEEFQHPIVISTWQSLAQKVGKEKNYKWKETLKKFDCVIMDEAHLCTAKELKQVLLNCENSKYRLGFTGTLPDPAADLYGVLSFIGPKVLDVQTRHLIDTGIISDLKIRSIHIEYDNKRDYKDLEWHEVKQKVFKQTERLELLYKICKSTRKNILILVSYVELEGKILEQYLKKRFPKKEIVFIHGQVPILKREDVRTSAEYRNNMIIIGTYGTLKMGINIKNIHRIILASPLKSKISNLQSIGRGLRALPNKRLIVYDLVDHVRFLWSHGKKRAKIWEKEKFIVEKFLLK